MQTGSHAERSRSTSPRHERLIALLLMLVAVSLPTLAAAQLREAFVDPIVTDPEISPLTGLPGAANRRLEHFVAFDPDRSNGYLYVHLVGSGGLPENNVVFARYAAESGFHVVSLAYPNWPSVRELTGRSGDPAAPGAVREERIFGIDASARVDVAAADGIVNRLVRLLQHLVDRHPGEGWERFVAGDAPRWPRIMIGGHSQGAGHAAYLAQEFELAGVILFGGPGDFVGGIGIADWVYRPLLTPSGRLYGFVHERDVNYAAYQLTQAVLGLADHGPVQDVDAVPASDWSSRRLTSSRLDVPDLNFHGAVVVDDHLPYDPNGQPGYIDAWDYMLGSVVFTDSFGD
jgi:hypothetical protein